MILSKVLSNSVSRFLSQIFSKNAPSRSLRSSVTVFLGSSLKSLVRRLPNDRVLFKVISRRVFFRILSKRIFRTLSNRVHFKVLSDKIPFWILCDKIFSKVFSDVVPFRVLSDWVLLNVLGPLFLPRVVISLVLLRLSFYVQRLSTISNIHFYNLFLTKPGIHSQPFLGNMFYE